MVYESDFYTTRRPYSRPTITSYTVTRREVPWHKVPTVPRPSQVPTPFTVYGSRHTPVSMDGAVPLGITWLRTLRIVQDVPKSSTPIPIPRNRRNPATTLPLPTPFPVALTRPARRGLPVPPVTVPEATATAVRELPAAQMRPADTVLPTAPSQPVDFLTRDTDEGPTTFHHNIPYIAHKRLVMVTPSAHGWRVNKSVLLGEIDRIYHKVRPSMAYQPTEDYLNSRAIVSFDDETRSIRAQTADLLRKIYTPIPRAQRPSPLAGELLDEYPKIKKLTMRHVIHPRYLDNIGSYYSYHELPITDRITSDHYIDRLLSANRDVHNHVLYLSYYDEPAKRYAGIGKGHLACVSFASGRPISRRRNLAAIPHDNIRNDITVLSHYGRFRAAAAAAANVHDSDYIPVSYLPPTKSAITGSWKSNAPQRTGSDRSDRSRDSYKPRELTAGAEFDAAMERKKKRREALEAAAMKELQEEKRHKQREEDKTKLAALEKEQEEQKQKEEAARLEAERLEAERKAAKEAERKAKEEEEEKLRKEEEEKKAKAEAKRKAEEEKRKKEEEERLAKEEAERKAKEEEERKAREEEERKAREEEERRAKEEEERKAKEEAERLAREEEERKAKQEAERLAKEEEERLAKEEEERLAKEEADRLAKEEEERLAKEEPENVAEEEEKVDETAAEEEQAPEESATKEEESANEETAEPAVEEPASPEPAAVAETPAAEENEEPVEAEEEAEEE